MFRHFFINETNKTIEVKSHLEFFLAVSLKDPEAKRLGIRKIDRGQGSYHDIKKFIKDNRLIRLSLYDNEVGIDSFLNPKKVFDIIKHFGEQYGFKKGYELTFENDGNGKWFTILWEYFISEMESPTELINRVSNMNIEQELIKIAGFLTAYDVQTELKKNEDHIFIDLEKNILGNDRLLKNFKAWVYRNDDDQTPYLDELKGSATVPRSSIERILSNYSPAFSKLNQTDKKSQTDVFFKSFKDLPIEDVKIESEGDFDRNIKYVQANWVLTNVGLSVNVDERKVKNWVEEYG